MLFPGRIDLGLGHSRTDQAAAYAMRRDLSSDADRFPASLRAEGLFPVRQGRVRAIPGEGLHIPIWILGSSLFGASSGYAPPALRLRLALSRQ